MASQTTLVDNAESDPDLDPLLDTQETPGQAADAAARPSGRALYVPPPLPMAELKQQLARAAEEEEASSCPTQRPPPLPSLDKAIDRRLVSCVDSDEATAKKT
jgi:hypothetical protein